VGGPGFQRPLGLRAGATTGAAPRGPLVLTIRGRTKRKRGDAAQDFEGASCGALSDSLPVPSKKAAVYCAWYPIKGGARGEQTPIVGKEGKKKRKRGMLQGRLGIAEVYSSERLGSIPREFPTCGLERGIRGLAIRESEIARTR